MTYTSTAFLYRGKGKQLSLLVELKLWGEMHCFYPTDNFVENYIICCIAKRQSAFLLWLKGLMLVLKHFTFSNITYYIYIFSYIITLFIRKVLRYLSGSSREYLELNCMYVCFSRAGQWEVNMFLMQLWKTILCFKILFLLSGLSFQTWLDWASRRWF